MGAVGPGPAPPAGWAAFVGAFDAYARAEGVVGGGALVMERGRIAARHAFGLADEARGQPVDDRTLFHWASCTKLLAAVAAVGLAARGRLALDARVTDLLPDLRAVRGPVADVRVWMLLAHTSGLPEPTWPWRTGDPDEPFEPARYAQVVALLPYTRLGFAPGTRFGYSNPAYVHLARIVEGVTGDPWAVYAQKNVWAPLGMGRSYVGATPYHLEADRSNGYVWETADGRPARRAMGREFDPGVTVPNGGWNAPLDDVAAFAAFLLGAPGGDAGRAARYEAVLPRAAPEGMWAPRVPVVPASVEHPGEAVGLGFFLVDGGAVVGHTGDQAGHRSFVYAHPAAGRAVGAVVNTTNRARGAASAAGWRAVVDAGLGLVR